MSSLTEGGKKSPMVVKKAPKRILLPVPAGGRGLPIPQSSSQTPSGGPTSPLNSDTMHPETVSDSIG